jgi:hypothetical protein
VEPYRELVIKLRREGVEVAAIAGAGAGAMNVMEQEVHSSTG